MDTVNNDTYNFNESGLIMLKIEKIKLFITNYDIGLELLDLIWI